MLLVGKVSEFPLKKMLRLQGASSFRINGVKKGAQGLVGRTPHNTMRYQRKMPGDKAAWKSFFKRLLRRGIRLQKVKNVVLLFV